MAKTTTTCECGGTYDGTPSGTKRHIETARHAAYEQAAIAGMSSHEPVVIRTQPTLAEEYAALPSEYGTDENLFELHSRQSAYRSQDADLKSLIKKRQADVKWAIGHAPEKVEKRQAILNTLIAEQTALFELMGETEKAINAVYGERAAVRREFWSKVDALVQETFQRDSDVYIRARGEGSYEVHLTTGKVLERHAEDCASRDGTDRDCNCEMVVWPETRFGFHADVNGLRSYSATKEFSVSWGSYSGMDTVAKAEDMMRVHGLSIEIAKFLNAEVLGL